MKKFSSLSLAIFTAGLLVLSAACGYRLAGRNARLPSNLRTIGIPVFINATTQYKVEQRLTAALVDEFIARTKYKILSSAEGADAVIEGRVNEVSATPVIFDPQGRATTFLIAVHVSVTLTETKTKKVLFENRNFRFREEFEISSDLRAFFQEEGPALTRLGKDFAQSLATAILEGF